VSTGNFFDKISKLAIWSTIELGTGITVASFAALRPLFRCAFEKMRSLVSKGRSKEQASQTGDASQRTPVPMSPDEDGKRMDSAASPMRMKSAGDKESLADLDVEMRAYGMSNLDGDPAVVDDDVVEDNHEEYIPSDCHSRNHPASPTSGFVMSKGLRDVE
jgi:hypothetical protein